MSRRAHADPTGNNATGANAKGKASTSGYTLPRKFVGMVASRINEFRNAPEKLSLDAMMVEAEAEAPNYVDKAVVRRALLSSPGIGGMHPLKMCLNNATNSLLEERGLAARIAISAPEEHAAVTAQFAGWRREDGGSRAVASSKAYIDLALQLMERGADVCAAGAVDQRSGFGGIVMTAVMVRDVSVLQAVLSADNIGLSDINAKGLPFGELFRCFRPSNGANGSTVTPLEAACLLGEDLLVGCLLDAGASVAGFTFAYAGCLRTPSAVSRLLVLTGDTVKGRHSAGGVVGSTKKKAGAIVGVRGGGRQPAVAPEQYTVNAADSHGLTALHYACRRGNADVVRLLLGHHRIVRPPGDVLLGEAIASGSPAVLEVLVGLGAVTAADLTGSMTPAMCGYGPQEERQQHHHAIRAVPKKGCTALHMLATFFGLALGRLTEGPILPSKAPLGAFASMLQLFMDAGADINARDADGATPLFYCFSAEAALALLAVPGCDADARMNPLRQPAAPTKGRKGKTHKDDHASSDAPPVGRTAVDVWMLGDGNILPFSNVNVVRNADDATNAFRAILDKMTDPAGALCLPVSRRGARGGNSNNSPVMPPSSLMLELALTLPPLGRPYVSDSEATIEARRPPDVTRGGTVDEPCAMEGSTAPAAIRLLLSRGVCPSASVGPMSLAQSTFWGPNDKENAKARSGSATVSAFFLATCIGRRTGGMLTTPNDAEGSFDTHRALLGVHVPTVEAMAAAGGAAKEPAVWLRYQLQRAIADRDAPRLEGLLRGASPALLAERLPTREEAIVSQGAQKLRKSASEHICGRTSLKAKAIRVIDDALLFCIQFTISQSVSRSFINSRAREAVAKEATRQRVGLPPPPGDEGAPFVSPSLIPSNAALVAAQVALLRLLLTVGGADPNAHASFPEPLIATLLRWDATLSIRSLRILIDEGGADVNGGLSFADSPLAGRGGASRRRGGGRGALFRRYFTVDDYDTDESVEEEEDPGRNTYRYVSAAIFEGRPDVALLLWARGCANGGHEHEVIPAISSMAARHDVARQGRMRRRALNAHRRAMAAEGGGQRFGRAMGDEGSEEKPYFPKTDVVFPRSFVAKSRAFVALANAVCRTIREREAQRYAEAAVASGGDGEALFAAEAARRAAIAAAYTKPSGGLAFTADGPHSRRLRLSIAVNNRGGESPAVNAVMLRNGADVNSAQHVEEIIGLGCASPTSSLVHMLCYLSHDSRLSRRQRYPTIVAAIEAGAEVNSVACCPFCAAVAATGALPDASSASSSSCPFCMRGATPLMTAVCAGWGDVVWLLLENGADRTAADAAGRRAFDWLKHARRGRCERFPLSSRGSPAAQRCDDALRISLDPSHVPTKEELTMIAEVRREREERLAGFAATAEAALGRTTLPRSAHATDSDEDDSLSDGDALDSDDSLDDTPRRWGY